MKISPEKIEKCVQFVKYCMVGVLNTLVTYGVIYICKSFLGMNLYVCNALGYLAGLTNSFFCNKTWVFHSGGSFRREMSRFLLGFAVCYILQFILVWMLTESDFGKLEFLIGGIVISGYGVATILGNVVYTLANFIYNKLVTFR